MKTLKFFILFVASMLLFGCTSLDYTGEDSKTVVTHTKKTSEDFVFSTVAKSLGEVNVNIGISKTPVQELLALYVQIDNLSYETPYTFKVDDLRVSDTDGEIQFITTNNYLSIYQAQEASSMSSLGTVGATFTNMLGMTSNYNEVNQSMMQYSSQNSNKDAYNKMEDLGNKILKHSIKVSSAISPRKSQYFYFFFQDKEKYPINVKYRTLNYQFNL